MIVTSPTAATCSRSSRPYPSTRSLMPSGLPPFWAQGKEKAAAGATERDRKDARQAALRLTWRTKLSGFSVVPTR
jgi:hypothetical protein